MSKAAPPTTAWGHALGMASLLVVALFVPAWPEAFTMPKVIIAAAIGAVMGVLAWSRRDRWRSNAVPLILSGAFAAFAVASQLISGAPQLVSLWGEWQRRSGTLTVLALVVLLAGVTTLSRPEVRVALAWLVWAGVPASIYGVIQWIGADPYAWNNQGWVVATFGNPNFAAAGLSILALLTGGLALTREFRTPWRWAMGALALAEAFLAVQTGSQQALFAILAGAFVGLAVWLARSQLAWRLPAFVALAAGAVVVAGLTVLGLLGSGPLVRFVSLDTLQFRQWYWEAGVRMATSHPIFGVGPDGYGRFYGEYKPVDTLLGPNEGATAAHDVPLQWAATLGIPAGVVYIVLMVSIIVVVGRRLWQQGHESSALLLPLAAGWGAYQIQSLVSIDATSVAFLGWLTSGLLLAVSLPAAVNPPVATSGRAWLVASFAALCAVIAWAPALTASNDSKWLARGMVASDAHQGVALVAGLRLPCDPKVRVAQNLIAADPSLTSVDAVIEGARADDRCYGLVTAAGDFALQLDRPDEALPFAQQAAAIDPLNPAMWMLLARAQRATGNTDGARASLEKAIAVSPGVEPTVRELAASLGITL